MSEPRTVWRNDNGMVVVREHPDVENAIEAFEVPAWVVKAIYACAGKDPEEEARALHDWITRLGAGE